MPDPATTPSPKVIAGGVAGAVSFVFWTIAVATFFKDTFNETTLAGLVAATTTILSAVAGYFKVDPLRT